MSRRPYECFKCRDSGFPNTMVYLAGKDDQGKTIQLEEDGTKHVHKGRTDVSTTVSDSRNAQESRSDNGQRTVIFTQENLDRIGSVYGQEDIEIEIEGRKPGQGQYASTHCGSVGSVGGNAYSDEDKGNVENKSPNDENYTNPGLEVKKDAALQESTDTPPTPSRKRTKRTSALSQQRCPSARPGAKEGAP